MKFKGILLCLLALSIPIDAAKKKLLKKLAKELGYKLDEAIEELQAYHEGGACDGMNYLLLNDPTRNMNYATPEEQIQSGAYCDKGADVIESYNTKSPDWQGSSWYRFVEPAGIKMPTEVVDINHCGSRASGFLNGPYPTSVGETVTRQVCFHGPGFPSYCHFSKTVEVKNCGGFYLFYLENSSSCDYRYCGAW